MAVPWAWAFDTPFSWTKQIVSHLGGVRQGMAISWPKVIKDKGGIRNQFHHVIDIVPTILEATGIKAAGGRGRHQAEPDRRGQHALHLRQEERQRALDAQDPVLRDVRRPRDLPRRLDGQHQGHACALGCMPCPRRACWIIRGSCTTSTNDWTQSEDLAAKNPAKLKELQELFWKEAEKYQVLPLDNTVVDRLDYAAAQPDRRPQRLHLDPADHGHPQRRCAEPSQRVVQLQGRDRGPAGRRRGHAHHAGRPLRRLRLLRARRTSRSSSGTWWT